MTHSDAVSFITCIVVGVAVVVPCSDCVTLRDHHSTSKMAVISQINEALDALEDQVEKKGHAAADKGFEKSSLSFDKGTISAGKKSEKGGKPTSKPTEISSLTNILETLLNESSKNSASVSDDRDPQQGQTPY